jgi:hypothetical protein
MPWNLCVVAAEARLAEPRSSAPATAERIRDLVVRDLEVRGLDMGVVPLLGLLPNVANNAEDVFRVPMNLRCVEKNFASRLSKPA